MSDCDKKEDSCDKNYDFSQEGVMKRLESGKNSMKKVKENNKGREYDPKKYKSTPSKHLDTQLFPNRKPLYHE
jgi:hypothetical protein